MRSSIETHPRLPDSLPGLTHQQTRVLAAVTRHETRKQAAAELGISIQTVKNHLTTAYARLGVTSLIGAVNALGWFQVPGDDEIVALCDAAAVRSRLRHAIDEAQTVLDRLDERPS